MALQLKKPLAVFDLETTGTDIVEDRIIEISIAKLLPNRSVETKTMLINPEIPIPRASSLIHGIYDEDVKDAPTFKQVAKDLKKFFDGCDLGGFSIIKFDVPILVEEFLRVEIDFDLKHKQLVDSQRIFHLMEKRTLSAAYKFYCNKSLDNAHSAEADTLATLEIIQSQAARYQGESVFDNLGKELGKVENNVASLADITKTKMVDLAGRFALNTENVEVFNFGKYRGKPIVEILQKEPQYYNWIMNGKFPRDTKRKLTEIKLRLFNR
ncbi:MAG: DNA polymerase III subunit epsilon [Cyclobacteriaceae bacterium]|nr:MAG: DNA polymerase III subunit epsilon [Cyclobacteriaceae bacterium]